MTWLWLVACRSPGSGGHGTDPPPTHPAESADPASTGDTGPALAFLQAPTLRDNPAAGLTGWLDASFDVPAELVIEVEAGSRTWLQREPPSTTHHVLLLGMLAGGDTRLTVTGVAEDGRVTAPVTLVDTEPPLPDDLKPPAVTASDPARVEPGTTLVCHHGYAMLLGADGEVVWYLTVGGVHEASFHDGHLWLNGQEDHIDEWDLAGDHLRHLVTPYAPPDPPGVQLPLLATHHELQLLPDGDLLTLDVERRAELYPTSETNPDAPERPAWVAGDVLTELTPDGAVVATWHEFDLADPQRIGRDSVYSDYWYSFPPWRGDETKDWCHANAASYDPATDTLLMSLRHQDAVLAFARATGEVRWILAPPANWHEPWASLVLAPADASTRPAYHQHAARFTSTGTVMMFDNGNDQASAFEPLPPGPVHSRAVEFRPDPATGTYQQVWSWDAGVFCPSLGDADPLPTTGNVLVTLGNPSVGWPRIEEVARDGTVVWEARMTFPGSWYRSQRVAGLFPWEDASAR